MKVIIKLLVAGLIANATWRVGNAYMSHYKFTDAVKSATQYRGDMTDSQVQHRLLELAGQYDIPVTEENLTVTRQDKHTIVESAYTRPIDVAPGFTYAWPFKLHVDTFIIEPQKFDGSHVR
jgi:hypothetical protein